MKSALCGIAVLVMILSSGIYVNAAERKNRIKNDATPVAAEPVTILSIIPAQAEPGAKVTLSGSGFGESATAFMGTLEINTAVTDAKQAVFTLPSQMEAGLYALYLKRADGTVGRSYNFTVLPLRPVLTALQPASISSCATGKEREVLAAGSNFTDSSMLFFNGSALSSRLSSSDSIYFSVPEVAGGLHQVQVKNAPENSSVPLTLVVETRPEIGQVTVGNEYVNFYELIVTGRNFTQNSSVYVDGVQVGGRGGQDMADREKLIYIDCTKLIYQRHPYSPVEKDFRLQVVNPGGVGSQVITVTAP
ncbi:MAG: IPT/TIG domain-containing protein [Desulfuromonadaceae bacterium]|nr:IPT/TIG domain-containing protein [Desulfuromonadaceae bacterium]MDD2856009.1 IPT/TIG domain-containing protein [Desulfuromonadaceae bacterium]